MSTAVGTDRTYWHVPGARSWHADTGRLSMRFDHYGPCGRTDRLAMEDVETADRLPPSAHFCGNCARSIAARTDIEQ